MKKIIIDSILITGLVVLVIIIFIKRPSFIFKKRVRFSDAIESFEYSESKPSNTISQHERYVSTPRKLPRNPYSDRGDVQTSKENTERWLNQERKLKEIFSNDTSSSNENIQDISDYLLQI